jgi:biopolymer transport protein ExbD
MAMSVGGDSSTEKPMSDINTTPLVDVMLVLLIIFLIAVPVAIQSVQLQLPKVVYEPTESKPENVLLAVTSEGGQCKVYWNNVKAMNSKDLLAAAVKKLEDEINRQGGKNAPGLELPEVHVRGDINTPYRCIGGTIYTMQMAGFVKVGFISEPEPGSVPQS